MTTTNEDFDITGKIGQLNETSAAWPMYSFDRPAFELWNAIGAELALHGWSETKIKDWLQSKRARWALDGKLGDELTELGRRYARDEILYPNVSSVECPHCRFGFAPSVIAQHIREKH